MRRKEGNANIADVNLLEKGDENGGEKAFEKMMRKVKRTGARKLNFRCKKKITTPQANVRT